MTIQIDKPELEKLIRQRLRSGKFHSVEDMLLDILGGETLKKISKAESKQAPGRKSLAQLFAESPLKGINLVLERDSDTGRIIDL